MKKKVFSIEIYDDSTAVIDDKIKVPSDFIDTIDHLSRYVMHLVTERIESEEALMEKGVSKEEASLTNTLRYGSIHIIKEHFESLFNIYSEKSIEDIEKEIADYVASAVKEEILPS